MFKNLIIISLPIIFNSCATITKDDSQPVAFSSEPQGAIVALNSIPRGTTPTTIMVKRKFGKSLVQVSKEGYETENFPLEKSVSGMTFGNIIFGGIIGAGVDVATGKATNYQDSVHIVLRPIGKINNENYRPPPRIPDKKDNFIKQPISNSSNQTSQQNRRSKLLELYIDGKISKKEYDEMINKL